MSMSMSIDLSISSASCRPYALTCAAPTTAAPIRRCANREAESYGYNSEQCTTNNTNTNTSNTNNTNHNNNNKHNKTTQY